MEVYSSPVLEAGASDQGGDRLCSLQGSGGGSFLVPPSSWGAPGLCLRPGPDHMFKPLL